jgi:hypothetical protein
MRYVDGESLADILAAEGKLSEERALNIFSQVCDALAHSHMKGIVHRDIKPSNIIISKTESGADMVHVVDFGIARCVYDEITKTQALTKAVDIFGSPRYMSPEQFLGQQVTGQSDIYSLGCVLYEMLTGAPPFTEENPVKLILQHIGEPADFSKIPVKIQLLLSQCLEKSPAARAPDVGYIQRTLFSMDSAVPLNGQSLALLHGMLAVILVMVASIPPMCGLTFIVAGVLSMLWLYVAALNICNAGRSLQYTLLEINLLLAFIANFSLALIPARFSHFSPLLASVLALTNLWLIMRNQSVEIYSRLISTIFGCLVKWAQVFNSRVLAGALLTSINVFMLVCSVGAAFQIIPPVINLVCFWDLKNQQIIRSFFFETISICLFASTIVVFLRLMYDRSLCVRSANQSLSRSLRIQSALVLGLAILSFGLTETLGRNGLYQFKRQQGNFLISSGNLQRLRLEALDYKDSPLTNRAKLIAGRVLCVRDKNFRIATELCDQVIDSKLEKEPLTLACAYSLRSKIRYTTGEKVLACSDWDKAFELLEVARSSKSERFDSSVYYLLGVPKASLKQEAIRLANLALDNKDIARSEKGLGLLRELDLPTFYISSMEQEIDALRNHKPPPNLRLPDFWD